ncbi:MAG: FtsX-like permease family protein [Phycisphaerales bacterium]
MHPGLRLSINNALGRPSRTVLLVLAVSLASALVASIACALSSLNSGLEYRVSSTIGRAEVQVREVGEQPFDASVLEAVRAYPEVAIAAPRAKGPLTLQGPGGQIETVVVEAIVPELEYELIDEKPDLGRRVEGDGELLLDEALATALGVQVGERVGVVRFGPEMEPLTVVGIRRQKTMEPVARAGAFTTIATLERASMIEGLITEIKVKLVEGGDAATLAERWQREAPSGIIVRTTERITSGIGQTIRANEFLFVMATVLSYLAAGFIVLTGLSSSASERQRELAIMRCIGATRGHLAVAQLGTGALLGIAGATVGVPLGIGLAWLIAVLFPDRLPAGLSIAYDGLFWAFTGAVVAGMLGAAFPAFKAARIRPLRAMASESRPASWKGVVALTAMGIIGLATQALIVGTIDDGARMFWLYTAVGLPAMFIGYFVLGVPVGMLVARLASPIITRLLRLPRSGVQNAYLAHPYRNGFTAGALMVGLAMMVSIWTNGSALLRDWLGAIKFPDAFVHGWLGIDADAQRRVEELPFVTGTVAITLQKIDSAAFGLRGFRETKTTFVAFEPEAFFEMTRLDWVAGDREHAIRRLKEGGAVLVAKEFLVQRNEYEVGQPFVIEHNGVEHEFEIVGAVSSPGLDLISKYFDIGREYADQAMHSVFGSRDDLIRVFETDAIHLIQIGLDGSVPDSAALPAIRSKFESTALVVGSGQEIKQEITAIGTGSMRIATIIAFGAMFIGCLGVGNVVIASIDARKHQFGILRAVGAGGGLVARMIFAEVLLIALTAALLGTALGLQGSWAGMRMYELIAGLELSMRPPVGALATGWAMLIGMTLLVTAPIIWRVARARPLALLGARG